MATSNNKVDVRPIVTGDATIDRFAREVVEAIRTLGTAFGGIVSSQFAFWQPYGVKGPSIWSGLFMEQTTSATNKILATYTLRDGASSLIDVSVLGRCTASREVYSKKMTGTFDRIGASVTTIGVIDDGNEKESVAGTNATLTITTTSAVVTVTGLPSKTFNWSCEIRVHEQP